ncbi:lamin tail domain-containing protein [uncultured Chitinophaga sp.]|uniref:lamin tail domain-containing protein n=1 Tax=uncultured Chitinophaga sp. TaxID=339340 RepID=UPI0025F7AAA9|nr:lamin tail domain-containing protein [uncultured Chitinophaga sp.]
MLTRIVCALLCAPLLANGQFSEYFDAPSVKELPAWKGTDSAWNLSNGVLQSASTRANTAFYLSRPVTLPAAAQWEWWMKLDFNTSSTNYTDVYLAGDAADLTAASGIFVRIGNTADEVSLYRKSPNAAPVKLIDGRDGTTNLSSSTLNIRVTYANGEWQLFTKLGDGGYTREGKAADTVTLADSYFGLLVRQSTTTFWSKHYFDNVICGVFQRDITAPTLVQLEVRDAQHIFVLFSESIDSVGINNFFASNGAGNPPRVERDKEVPAAYHLYYEIPFMSGQPFNFHIKGVMDEAGNQMTDVDSSLVYYLPQRYDVVIHEIFADPSPVIGLPAYEFLELHNRSAFPVNVGGWTVQTGSGNAKLPSFWLKPDSCVILCAAAAQPYYMPHGMVLSPANFPTLTNEADRVVLFNADGAVIHSVEYSSAWYGNSLKQNGGWSLEMIDLDAACIGAANWKASVATMGGSPGKANSVVGQATQEGPVLTHLTTIDSSHVRLHFSMPLNSVNGNNFLLAPGNLPTTVMLEPPMFQQVTLQLPFPMVAGQLYSIRSAEVMSCNEVTASTPEINFGLPGTPAFGDLLISETLFNPPATASDFVEIYNRSNKVIDLSGLYLANRKSDGALDNITRLTLSGRQLLPANYSAFTEQRDALCRHYACKAFASLLETPPLPSFPNAEGSVVLLDAQGNVIDEVRYSEKQHFALIKNPKGISLERTTFADMAIWHSASSSAGYATPGYVNSQLENTPALKGTLTAYPEVFSPDNDGRDDLAFIGYNFTSPGKVANITIFDAGGRPVKALARNQLLGNTGKLSWDGLSDSRQPLRPGIYIVYAEVFDLGGKVDKWKLPLVLAGNMGR